MRPVVLLLALGLAACGASLPPSDRHEVLATSIAPMRDMALGGKAVSVPVRGKVTLIDFWATTCEPCVRLMPAIGAMARDLGPRGLAVVGVARDDNPGLVQRKLDELGVTYPVVLDGQGGQLAGAFHVGATLPQTFLVDAAGRVRFVKVGESADQARALREAAEALLGE